MGKFKGIVTNQTVSDGDFKKILTMPAEDIDKYSSVKVEIVENQDALYKKMAKSIADLIIENNKRGRITKIILPVGPVPQYPLLANICNEEKIDLTNLWVFFMDEYLDWECRVIDEFNPMSFKGFMKKNLFNLISNNCNLNFKQIIFPDPKNLDYPETKIEELGGIDVCYGGIGYHGHIAFNEPYDTYFRRMTIEDYINSRTRIVDFNSDTFVINSICGLDGNPYGVPPKAVTIGMKPIMESKKIELYCDGGDLNWQIATFRIASMFPPTLDRPITLLQLRKDPKETITFIADKRTSQSVRSIPK